MELSSWKYSRNRENIWLLESRVANQRASWCDENKPCHTPSHRSEASCWVSCTTRTKNIFINLRTNKKTTTNHHNFSPWLESSDSSEFRRPLDSVARSVEKRNATTKLLIIEKIRATKLCQVVGEELSNYFLLFTWARSPAIVRVINFPFSGPRPTRSTREQSGAVDEEDFEDFTELDPEWTKRRLFGKYCWDLCKEVRERERRPRKRQRVSWRGMERKRNKKWRWHRECR